MKEIMVGLCHVCGNHICHISGILQKNLVVGFPINIQLSSFSRK